jgi:uncharacterized protein (TIGR00661 family)
MGHCTRSDTVIEYMLKKGHEVIIFTSGRAYEVLSKKYPSVHCIKGFWLNYENGMLNIGKSIMTLIKHLPKELLPTLKTLTKELVRHKPHVIISDFEFFTTAAGRVLGIPVIAANNNSIVNKTLLEVKSKAKVFAKLAAALAQCNADQYVIATFFFPPVKSDNVVLTNPPVRQLIAKLKPSAKKHVLVYHTTPTFMQLLETLKGLDERFEVYGFGGQKDTKNMKFHKEFNEKNFAKHLATAKAVITGGGFSLITEALYLKKPVFSVPVRKQYEQAVNAFYIEKLGYGMWRNQPKAEDVKEFLKKLPEYRKNLEKYSFKPDEFSKAVEKEATRLAREPDTKRFRIIEKIFG